MNTDNTQCEKAEAFLYHLVDKVWNVVTESEEVPDPQWSQQIISDARKSFDEKRTLELLKACEISPPAQPSPDEWREDAEEIFKKRIIALGYVISEGLKDAIIFSLIAISKKANIQQERLKEENENLRLQLEAQDSNVEILQSQLTQLREENERLNKLVNNMPR